MELVKKSRKYKSTIFEIEFKMFERLRRAAIKESIGYDTIAMTLGAL